MTTVFFEKEQHRRFRGHETLDGWIAVRGIHGVCVRVGYACPVALDMGQFLLAGQCQFLSAIITWARRMTLPDVKSSTLSRYEMLFVFPVAEYGGMPQNDCVFNKWATLITCSAWIVAWTRTLRWQTTTMLPASDRMAWPSILCFIKIWFAMKYSRIWWEKRPEEQ